MLIDKIKYDQIAARKVHDTLKASVLTTLIGEAEMIGKNNGNRPVTDSEVIALIKKFIKNMDETLSYISNDPSRTDTLTVERNALEGYLPKQLNREELRATIEEIIVTAGNNLGKIMALLKARHEGCYDGREAATLIKELLA